MKSIIKIFKYVFITLGLLFGFLWMLGLDNVVIAQQTPSLTNIGTIYNKGLHRLVDGDNVCYIVGSSAISCIKG